MPHRRLVLLTGRRHPHELMLLGASVLQGVAYVATLQAPPNSVVSLLPAPMVVAWFVLLLVSGVVGLSGNLWPGNLVTALRIRLSGMLLAAAPAAVYAIAIAVVAGSSASYAAGLTGAWAGACLWRAGQLAGDLRQVRETP